VCSSDLSYPLIDDFWRADVKIGVTLTVWNAAGQSSSVAHVAHLQNREPPPA
jgi:hypothetical protein